MSFSPRGVRASTLLAAVIATVFLCATAVESSAMLIRNYSSAKHNVSSSTSFIGYGYDWTGIASDTRVTLVSPSYFISANHYHPGVGGSLTFTNSSGSTVVRTIQSGARVTGTDIWVGKLSSAIPGSAGIAYYPVLDLGSTASFLGLTMFNYGAANTVGRNVIDSVQTVSGASGINALYVYDNPGLGDDETWLQGGDSGRPSFIASGGQLTLLGAHYFIWDDSGSGGDQGSGDTFLPNYIDEINALMGDESLTIALVPEPATLLLVGAGLLGVALCRRRRRAA